MGNEHVYITNGEGAGLLKTMSHQEAQDIKVAGRGHIMDMQEYNNLEERSRAALTQFKDLEKRMKTSDDPRLGTPEVRAYVIKEAEEKLAAEIAQIDEEWEQKKAEIIEQARLRAATHTVNVTPAEQQLGSQFVNRYAVQLASIQSPQEQKAVLVAMNRDIERMSDSQRVALQPHLLSLSGVVKEGVSISNVLRTSTEMQSPELVQAKAAEQLPLRASTAYHQMQLIRKARNGNLI